MEPVSLIFLAACCGAITFTSRDGGALHWLAWGMAAIWAAANLAWLYGRLDALPLFDLPMAMASYALLCVEPRPAHYAVATAFAFRMTLHLPGAWGMMPVDIYLHWINAAFLAALVAISWEGGRRVFDRLCGHFRRFLVQMARHPQVSGEAA